MNIWQYSISVFMSGVIATMSLYAFPDDPLLQFGGVIASGIIYLYANGSL